MTIRVFKPDDWEAVNRIYAEGAISGKAVFRHTEPTWEEWDTTHKKTCRLVAVEDDKVLGWTALSPVSNRCVDSGAAKVSIYVAADCRGKGVGKALMNSLIEAAEHEGIWTLQSSVIRENTVSAGLCETCGFRLVGYHERINRDDNGIWHDLLLFERRSKVLEGDSSCC